MSARLMLLTGLVVFACLTWQSGIASAGEIRERGGGPELEMKSTCRPVLRISLRIHLGKSAWQSPDFIPIAEEISSIWLGQAGICFETEIVLHDHPAADGFDLWFAPVLQQKPSYNGLFHDEHDIHVRDLPVLDPAKHPARSATARTAAHEMGHALGLRHRQDSADNLMRSKTYGWQLNAEEIRRARRTALSKALPDREPQQCGVVIRND